MGLVGWPITRLPIRQGDLIWNGFVVSSNFMINYGPKILAGSMASGSACGIFVGGKHFHLC